MPVAGDAEIVGATHIDAGLDRMVARDLGDVGDHLKLLLVLIKRTVAAADAVSQPRSKRDAAAVAVAANEKRGQTRRERVVEIQPWNPGVGCGCRSEVGWEHVDAVVEPAESEVGQERCRQRVVDPVGNALVARVGNAAKRDQLVAASLTKGLRAVAQEVAEAVAAERVQIVAQATVDPDVERIGIETLRARRDVVVDRPVLASRRVRQRNQAQDGKRLWR